VAGNDRCELSENRVVSLRQIRSKFVITAGVCTLGLLAAACSSSTTTATGGSSVSIKAIHITPASFTRTFAAMTALKPLAAKGKGNVAVILPDTVSSARYTEFDAPYLTEALQSAGLSPSQFTVQNAQGSDATELSDAQTAITKGASVLIMDPLDSGVGAQIESYAKAHGVPVIDYDRLTLGGSRKYYVSFNNVFVGTLLGKAGVNIGSYHQARLAIAGREALAAVTVDQAPTDTVLAALGGLPDVLEVKLANLGG